MWCNKNKRVTYSPKSPKCLNMLPDLTVKNCVDYLRIVLTEFIQITACQGIHLILNEIFKLKDYVNSINNTSIQMGTIFTLLVNNYMILITSHQGGILRRQKRENSRDINFFVKIFLIFPRNLPFSREILCFCRLNIPPWRISTKHQKL